LQVKQGKLERMGGGRVKDITEHSQLESIIKDAGSNLVVVDFSAAWCGPCRMIAPYYAELSEQFSNVTFAKVDVDQVEASAQAYSVEAMPTFVFIKDGKELSSARLTGASKDRLKSTIEQNA